MTHAGEPVEPAVRRCIELARPAACRATREAGERLGEAPIPASPGHIRTHRYKIALRTGTKPRRDHPRRKPRCCAGTLRTNSHSTPTPPEPRAAPPTLVYSSASPATSPPRSVRAPPRTDASRSTNSRAPSPALLYLSVPHRRPGRQRPSTSRPGWVPTLAWSSAVHATGQRREATSRRARFPTTDGASAGHNRTVQDRNARSPISI